MNIDNDDDYDKEQMYIDQQKGGLSALNKVLIFVAVIFIPTAIILYFYLAQEDEQEDQKIDNKEI